MLKGSTKCKTQRALDCAVELHARPNSLQPHVLGLMIDQDRDASVRRTKYLYPNKPPAEPVVEPLPPRVRQDVRGNRSRKYSARG